jgi:lipopolysaccharide transport system permease protein
LDLQEFRKIPQPIRAPVNEEHILSSDVHVIEPARGLRLVDPTELWRWRELFLALIVRDIAVRYKQTAIGIAWVVIQPLATVAVFSFLLGKIGNVPTGGLPYPLFAFAAMVPWQVFSRALVEGSMSLAGNRSLVTKVYFPRILMPAAAVFGGAVDFGITLLILLAMMMWFGFVPSWQILLTPALLALALLTSLGVALWLSALNVLYRDVQFVLPFLAQIWLFLTPVLYPASVIPEKWRLLYAMNPMVTVTESFRWAVLSGATAPEPLMLLVSTATVFIVLLSGIAYFRHVEREMADWI